MTTIKVIGSSSRGNGYIVESENQILLLELGCKYNDFMQSLNFEEALTKVKGCLVSHKHSDHLRKTTVAKMLKYNIPIYSTRESCDKFEGITPIPLGKKTHIGGFYIQPFPLFHDCECFGFIIICPDGVRICFATDTSKIPYKFKDIHCYMVECNNSLEYVVENAINGCESRSSHLTHLSDDKTVDFLRTNFSSSVQQIILIHLSSSNGHATKFVDEVKTTLGFNRVKCAQCGDIYEVDTSEF
jgi:phosphoribosyl 1,2-cyclic phosphodiesterase